MIETECIICGNKFEIKCEEILINEIEGCTLDCPECNRTLIVEDNKLKDLNEVLKKRYKKMGATIDDKIDYTKFFIQL